MNQHRYEQLLRLETALFVIAIILGLLDLVLCGNEEIWYWGVLEWIFLLGSGVSFFCTWICGVELENEDRRRHKVKEREEDWKRGRP